MRAALFALLLTTAPALAAGPPAKPGQNYLAARQAMVQAGYRTSLTRDLGHACPLGYEAECKTYDDLYDCRGTGLGGCSFVFWKDDQPVLVETQGEELARQRVTKVKVMTVAEQKRLFLNQ